MTKDEIMELARQAGFVYAGESFQDLNKPIEAFAKLVEERTIGLALETLEKIANVNAMDYEYQAWAREALKQLNTEETV
jgi:hypothetical protein